jgi:hypothetical protein
MAVKEMEASALAALGYVVAVLRFTRGFKRWFPFHWQTRKMKIGLSVIAVWISYGTVSYVTSMVLPLSWPLDMIFGMLLLILAHNVWSAASVEERSKLPYRV